MGAVVRLGARAAAAVAMASMLGSCSSAVDLPQPEATRRTLSVCRDLVAALPDRVADQSRRDVEPSDALGAAWGDPPIVVTCGGPPPQGFGPGSSCLTVDGVDWYLPEEQLAAPGESQGLVRISTVKRQATVTVELPADYWPPATALADVSTVVERSIPATSRCR